MDDCQLVPLLSDIIPRKKCKPRLLAEAGEKGTDINYFPQIELVFEGQHHPKRVELYSELIRQTLQIILKDYMKFEEGNIDADLIADESDQLLNLLPLINVNWPKKIPGDICFYSLSKYRTNAYNFFFTLLTNWLCPGKRLNVTLVSGIDFRLPDVSPSLFTLCEINVRVENIGELQQMQTNFPIIESELIQGIVSSDAARRILEIKGLVHEEKTVFIQEYAGYLINRLPDVFDQDLLTEMQHMLVMCSENFKAARKWRHLCRMIAVQYLFRKSLRISVKQNHSKRYLKLKIFRALVNVHNKTCPVLGVLVGLNYIRENEIFEKKHLLKAIQNYIPDSRAVEDSFVSNRRGTEPVFTLYLEIEKGNGKLFTQEDVKLLQQELSNNLKDRIEYLMHPVFLPRNEEEVIRNILILNHQIKYLRDIPQVIVSFDEQTDDHLLFLVILTRVVRSSTRSVQELFYQSGTSLEYIHDRHQITGTLRRKYKKETTVFRLKLLKDSYLRVDHSLDLNKARQAVTSELLKVVGEFRDFNGGMISKQNEILCELRVLLQGVKYSDLMLENFFYSLNPVIMRNILEPEVLFILFSMLLESIDVKNGHFCRFFRQKKNMFVIIKTDNCSIREELNREISKLKIPPSKLTSSYIPIYDAIYKGYIYQSDDPAAQDLFCSIVEHIMTS